MPWIVDAVIAVAPIVIGAVIILKMPWGPFLKACAAVAYAAIMVSMIVVVGLTNAFP